jgi:hypothetical protein
MMDPSMLTDEFLANLRAQAEGLRQCILVNPEQFAEDVLLLLHAREQAQARVGAADLHPAVVMPAAAETV